jgi:hypothetical protein
MGSAALALRRARGTSKACRTKREAWRNQLPFFLCSRGTLDIGTTATEPYRVEGHVQERKAIAADRAAGRSSQRVMHVQAKATRKEECVGEEIAYAVCVGIGSGMAGMLTRWNRNGPRRWRYHVSIIRKT